MSQETSAIPPKMTTIEALRAVEWLATPATDTLAEIKRALEFLRESHPDLSFFITLEAAVHSHMLNDAPRIAYRLSILPGLDGSNCQGFGGVSLLQIIGAFILEQGEMLRLSSMAAGAIGK